MEGEHLAIIMSMLTDEEDDIANTQLQLTQLMQNRQTPLLPAFLTV